MVMVAAIVRRRPGKPEYRQPMMRPGGLRRVIPQSPAILSVRG